MFSEAHEGRKLELLWGGERIRGAGKRSNSLQKYCLENSAFTDRIWQGYGFLTTAHVAPYRADGPMGQRAIFPLGDNVFHGVHGSEIWIGEIGVGQGGQLPH